MKPFIRSQYLFLLALLCLQQAVLAQSGIVANIDDLNPLKAGDPAPTFTVYKVDGSVYTFDPDKQRRPTLIIFYRGGWCGACNQQLRDISTVMADILEMDVNVFFPNGDRSEILYSSLHDETKEAIQGLDYQLFSDSGLNAAQAFRVAYVLDEEVLKRYRSRDGWDLFDSSIDKFDALPLPSIYIIGTDGKIAFNYYNLDPTIRLPAEDLREAVRKVVQGN